MADWSTREDAYMAEYRGESAMRLAKQPKAPQAGPSLPRVIEASPDHLVCAYCTASHPWMDWWDAGGINGRPTCPDCGAVEEEEP